MKATIITETKQSFLCPKCNVQWKCGFDHISRSITFGPWYCHHCGHGVYGRVTDDDLQLEESGDHRHKTLVLLRLDIEIAEPIHIVINGGMICKEGADLTAELAELQRHNEFLYAEHTCPWNYLRVRIKEGDDCDPHGIFVHQETVLAPPDVDSQDLDHIDYWRALFPSLRGKS